MPPLGGGEVLPFSEQCFCIYFTMRFKLLKLRNRHNQFPCYQANILQDVPSGGREGVQLKMEFETNNFKPEINK